MVTKKQEEIKARLEKMAIKKKQLTAQLQRHEALDKERGRKKRDHAMILIGVAIEKEMIAGGIEKEWLKGVLKTHLSKDHAKAPLEYLSPQPQVLEDVDQASEEIVE